MNEENSLKKVAESLARLDLTSFDDLPDLGLYMDQVTGYLNRRLHPLSLGREEAPLTPSMINNYVKSGHISRPMQKKYSREQISALYMLCSLKKNLSINDAAALIYFLSEQYGSREGYNRFVSGQGESMQHVCDRFLQLHDEKDTAELTELALDLAQRACAERLAAEALISYLIVKDDAKMARAREAAEKERAERELAARAEKEAAEAKKEAARAEKRARKADGETAK